MHASYIPAILHMMTSVSCKILTSLAVFTLLASGQAFGQRSISFLALAQGQVSKPRFVTDNVVSPRLSLRLKPDRTLGIGMQYNVAPTWGLKATAAVLDYGLEFADQSDYVRNKWRNKGKMGFTVNSFEYALALLHAMPMRKQLQHHWLFEVGVDVVDVTAGVGIGDFSLVFGTAMDLGQGGVLQGTFLRYSPMRVGLRVAAGPEWMLSAHGYLAVQLLGSIGLTEAQRWQLDYTVWDISRTVDPVTYRNFVGAKMSYLGIRAAYRFQL